jgi:hypothetical protein
VSLCAHSDSYRTIFLSTCYCYTHVQGNVVAEPVVDSPVPVAATPIIGSLVAEVDEEVEPVFQEPIANHELEQQ